MADLRLTRTVGTRRVGDVGASLWVAEQLDVIKLIDQACGLRGATDGPSVGEMVLAVAVQRGGRPNSGELLAGCWLAPNSGPQKERAMFMISSMNTALSKLVAGARNQRYLQLWSGAA